MRRIVTHPMDRGPVVLQTILDRNVQGIAPRSANRRTWILPVDKHAYPGSTSVRVASGVGNLQGIRHRVAGCWKLLVIVGSDTVSSLPASSCGGTIHASRVSLNSRGLGVWEHSGTRKVWKSQRPEKAAPKCHVETNVRMLLRHQRETSQPL